MGVPKATMPFGDEPLLARVVRRLHSLSDDVMVVTQDGRSPIPLPATVRVLADVIPDAGPLAGLVSGLKQARHLLVAVVSCDAPFVSPDVLAFLSGRIGDADAAVPLVDGRRQSLQAVYRASAGAESGERALAEGLRRLDDLLARLRVLWVQGRDMRRIPAWRRSFLNVNTPDILRQALALAAEERDRR